MSDWLRASYNRLHGRRAPVLPFSGCGNHQEKQDSGDLAFVFGNTKKVGTHWQADDHLVSALMAEYWTNFAKTGNPNAQGLPDWQPYDAENHSTQLLRPDAHTVAGVRRAKLDLWDARFASD